MNRDLPSGNDPVTDVLSFPPRHAEASASGARRCRLGDVVMRRCRRTAGARRRAAWPPNCRCWRCTACCTCSATITRRDDGTDGGARARGCAARADWPGLIERGPRMIPLVLFLLACAAVYVGTIQAAFSALMQLSLRLQAEREGRSARLEAYLEDPACCSCPTRVLLGLIVVLAGEMVAQADRHRPAHSLLLLFVAVLGFLIVSEHLVPQIIVRRGPQECSRAAAVVRRRRRGRCAHHARPATRRDMRPRDRDPRRRTVVDATPTDLTEDPPRRWRGRARVDRDSRGLPRQPRARGDDAAARHRRDSRRGDARRAARVLPRAGVLAHPGLQGQARQHPRLRVRQGPDQADDLDGTRRSPR